MKNIMINGFEFKKALVLKDINMGDINNFDFEKMPNLLKLNNDNELIIPQNLEIYYGKNDYNNEIIINYGTNDQIEFDIIFDDENEYIKY